MYKAKEISEWNRTSEIWVILANANRDEKKCPRPFRQSDIHPFAPKPKPEELPRLSMKDLKQVYVKK